MYGVVVLFHGAGDDAGVVGELEEAELPLSDDAQLPAKAGGIAVRGTGELGRSPPSPRFGKGSGLCFGAWGVLSRPLEKSFFHILRSGARREGDGGRFDDDGQEGKHTIRGEGAGGRTSRDGEDVGEGRQDEEIYARGGSLDRGGARVSCGLIRGRVIWGNGSEGRGAKGRSTHLKVVGGREGGRRRSPGRLYDSLEPSSESRYGPGGPQGKALDDTSERTRGRRRRDMGANIICNLSSPPTRGCLLPDSISGKRSAFMHPTCLLYPTPITWCPTAVLPC